MWLGQRLTRAGEGGHVGDSGLLCLYTRHWETHSNTLIHSHTLTRPCTHTGACFCPPPHGLCAGITEGSPVFSPVQGVEADHSPRAETSPDLQALPGRPSQNLQDSSAQLEADRHQQRGHRPVDQQQRQEFLLKVIFPNDLGRMFV